MKKCNPSGVDHPLFSYFYYLCNVSDVEFNSFKNRSAVLEFSKYSFITISALLLVQHL